MSSTTTTHETISDVQQANIILERLGRSHSYCGQEGFHHHAPEVINHVTQSCVEQLLPENSGLVSRPAKIVHTEALEETDNRNVNQWPAYSAKNRTKRPLPLEKYSDEVTADVR